MVNTCNTCQLIATPLPQPQKELQPITPTDRICKHVGIDLNCDLPVTQHRTVA